MWNAVLDAFRNLTPLGALDFAVVAFIAYQVYRFARGTRVLRMLWGITALGIFYYLATLAGLRHTSGVLAKVLLYVPFVVILIFQSTIRRALIAVGFNPFRLLFRRGAPSSRIEDIVLAAQTLASRRQGALFVIEREQGLRNYIETGIALDARLSYDLLLNLFAPDTPLHDGAVIVQEDKIAAAACYLPLTLRPALSRAIGTRHRAAIGITEETDALAVAVSEERGIASFVMGGEIIENIDAEKLRALLREHLGEKTA